MKFTCLGTFNRYKQPPPEWSVFREASFGHGELKMVNSTHAFWSWHRNDDDEPVRSDQVWITSLISSGCNTGDSHELRKILMASQSCIQLYSIGMQIHTGAKLHSFKGVGKLHCIYRHNIRFYMYIIQIEHLLSIFFNFFQV